MNSLENKSALVTGGARGIGRACTDELLAHGANVAITYNKSVEAAKQLKSENPDHVSIHHLDLADVESINRLVEEIEDVRGRIDILVNNAAAGSSTISEYQANPTNEDASMFQINATGALHMCERVIEQMEAAKVISGKIINISSVGATLQVFPGFRLSDAVSKAAVAAMSRQLAAKHVHSNIDIFAVCPGATSTEMLQRSTLDKMDENQRKEFLERLPKQRLIEPSEIAKLISFLASEYSTCLHGAVIDASMGLGVRPGLITEI